MKIALILIICTIVILIGYGLSKSYLAKTKFLNSLKNLLEDIKLNVTFKKEKLINVLEKSKSKSELKVFLTYFTKYIESGAVSKDELKNIDTDNTDLLYDIITNIGKYNSATELVQIDSYIEQVKLLLTEAEKKSKTFAPMIVKLAILLSLAIGVVLL